MHRLLVFLLLLAQFAAAQPLQGRVFLQQFGPAEGLLQPFIYALVQDQAGYLWLDTAEGLVRFDGTEFVKFTPPRGAGLTSNEEDASDRLVGPRGIVLAGH